MIIQILTDAETSITIIRFRDNHILSKRDYKYTPRYMGLLMDAYYNDNKIKKRLSLQRLLYQCYPGLWSSDDPKLDFRPRYINNV